MPFDVLHNEKELLSQVSQGDREAFRIMYTTCYPQVKRYISLFESSGNVLEELTQDVFVRIWEKRVRLMEVESFQGYLFVVTRNVVLNFFRALKVRQKIKELDETVVPGDNELENELDAEVGDEEEGIGNCWNELLTNCCCWNELLERIVGWNELLELFA